MLSRQDIAARILAGEHLIVFHDQLLRIPHSWLHAHPGGSLALLHFVGRDATDEIQAYHSPDTLSMLRRFSIGRIDLPDGLWLPLLPPVMSGWVRNFNSHGTYEWYREDDGDTQHPYSRAPTLATLSPPPTALSLQVQVQHAQAYRQLHKRIVDAGLYNTPYLSGYGPELARYLFLAAISAYAYFHNWLITSAIALGLMWHQLVFTAHDLGHMGVTHNWTIDRLLATFVANFIGGLSIGWWVDNHNVHHLVTNHPSHDPDIQHLPFFAISPAFLSSLWSSYYKRVIHFDRFAKVFIAIQHKLFYVVMAFARFNLYALSYRFLLKKAFDKTRARGGRWAFSLEIAGILFFWCWFGSLLYGCGSWIKALVYLLVSHVVTSPLHVQIVLSHFSMSTADLGPTESFVHRQMRTTTDVICSDNVSFLHGGLHLQVTHHLFPRLPRHNLRQASQLVKEFAKEQGLVYAEFGFVSGNQKVLGVLRDVADQVKVLGKVASVEAREAVDKRIAEQERKKT